MSLSVGIVGLPNAGKSTLFNALLGRQVARAENYPFCTIDPNIGVVEVPDNKLPILGKVAGSRQVVPAVVKFIDIAGLVKGAATGEGLGNRFLAHIREVDLICYILRAFADENVSRAGSINPQEDLAVLRMELALKDLEVLENFLNKKTKTEEDLARLQLAKKITSLLKEGKLLNTVDFTDEEKEILDSFFLLTTKPELIVLNVEEKMVTTNSKNISDLFSEEVMIISAKMETELSQLSPKERKEYLVSLGVNKSSLEQLINQAYKNLGLVSFYTANNKEARAWSIKKGALASWAAGIVHSDFEKNFIKAEIVSLDQFIKLGGWVNCRNFGKTRFEGRDYQFVGNEVVEFRAGK